MSHETIGKQSSNLLLKTPETRDPIELQREMQKDYTNSILECVKRGKKDIDSESFYVMVETKKERLMQNVIRNYFFFRRTCPTPTYDQTVYFYDRPSDRIEFLWVVPSKHTCILLKTNALSVAEEERELLKHVLDFEDNTLLQLAKKRNGEQLNTILLQS